MQCVKRVWLTLNVLFLVLESFSVNPFIHSPLLCACDVLYHHHYFFIFADSSPSHPSVSTHPLPPALCEDSDEFSDFQGPLDAPASFLAPPSSSTFGFSTQARVQPSSSAPSTVFSQDYDDFVQGPTNFFPSSIPCSQAKQVQPSPPSLRAGLSSSSSSLNQSLSTSVSIPTVTQHSTVNTSSAFQGNSSFAFFTPPLPSSNTDNINNKYNIMIIINITCFFF